MLLFEFFLKTYSNERAKSRKHLRALVQEIRPDFIFFSSIPGLTVSKKVKSDQIFPGPGHEHT